MPNISLSMSTVLDCVGKELGISEWITINQESINAFADCTGDHQWIHVDVDRAKKESPFGGPIAHGYLTLSLLPQLNMNIGFMPKDAIAAFNYGLDKVRFLTPVKAGAKVRAKASLVEVTDQGGGRILIKLLNTIEIEGEAKPALVAESLALLVGRP